MYRFFLTISGNRFEIDEPKGIRDVNSVIKRDFETHGVFFEYTQRDIKIGFICQAKDSLENLYLTKGVDAEAFFEIEYREDKYKNWYVEYSGKINFKTRRKTQEYFECTVSREDLITNTKNRLEVSIDLQAERTIDGDLLPESPVKGLIMHAKVIRKISNYSINRNLTQNNFTNFGSNFNYHYAVPLELNTSEIEGSLQPIPGFFKYIPRTSDPGDGFIPVPESKNIIYTGLMQGDQQRTFTLQGKISASVRRSDTAPNNRVALHLLSYNLSSAELLVIKELTEQKLVSNTFVEVEAYINETITVGSDIAIIVAVWFLETDEDGKIITLDVNFDPDGYLDITEDTITDDIETELGSTLELVSALKYKDALARCLHTITGIPDVLYSPFLDNELGNLLVTIGKKIRMFPDAKILTTTKDLLDNLRIQFCTGYAIEGDPGSQKVAVRPMREFYSGEQILVISDVSDYEDVVAEDELINQLIIGYKNYAKDTTEKNTIDDIHTEHEYYLPLKSVKKKLELKTEFIASAYLIEETRRKNYKFHSTERWKYDDDIFLIWAKEFVLTLFGASVTLYQAEKDEAFDIVDNILSPETMYNLRLSPKRMMLNWYEYLNSFLYYNDYEDEYKSQKVINNAEALTRLKSTEPYKFGDFQNFERTEGDNEKINRVGAGQRIFKPEIVRFKKGLCSEDIDMIRKAHENRLSGIDVKKNYGYITVINPDNVAINCFLLEMRYNPIDRKAEFTCIKKAGPVDIPSDVPGLLQESLGYDFVLTEDDFVVGLE